MSDAAYRDDRGMASSSSSHRCGSVTPRRYCSITGRHLTSIGMNTMKGGGRGGGGGGKESEDRMGEREREGWMDGVRGRV